MNKKLLLLKFGILIAMIAWALLVYDKLPDSMPTHRNFEGKADAYWPKNYAIYTIPWITLIMIILFPVLSRLDPKKENYEKFSKYWEIMQFTIIWFFAYLQFVTLYISLNPEKSINFFMLLGLWVLFILLGNYMWKIRRNYFIWVKTPWTLENDEVWNKTSRLSWWIFVLSWIVFVIQAFVMKYIVATFIISISACILFPFIYSYIIFKNLKN